MSTYCFSVQTDTSPSSLPRVLEVFALHGYTPERCHSAIGGSSGEELIIDIQMSGLDRQSATLIAKRIERVVTVERVLFSEKVRCAAA